MDQYCKSAVDARYWVHSTGTTGEAANAAIVSSGCYQHDPTSCTHPDHPMRNAGYWNYNQAVIRGRCTAHDNDGGHTYCPSPCLDSASCGTSVPILCCR